MTTASIELFTLDVPGPRAAPRTPVGRKVVDPVRVELEQYIPGWWLWLPVRVWARDVASVFVRADRPEAHGQDTLDGFADWLDTHQADMVGFFVAGASSATAAT